MKRWSIPLIALLFILLVPASATMVAAGEEAGLVVTKSADRTSAVVGDTITYSYTIINTDNVTISNLSLEDDRLGIIPLSSTTLAPGNNVTATATYTITISDLPGPIINTAKATGVTPDGILLSATSNQVSVSLTLNKALLTKAEILKLSGVPGRGIDKAPGLQKKFNPKSRAAEHAGKKWQPKVVQLKTKNGGQDQIVVQKQSQLQVEVENQAVVDQVNGKSGVGKGFVARLLERLRTIFQAWEQR